MSGRDFTRARFVGVQMAGAALAVTLLAGAALPTQAMVFKFSQAINAANPCTNPSLTGWSYLRRDLSNIETPLTNCNVTLTIWKNAYNGTPGTTLEWNSPNLPDTTPGFLAHDNFILWWYRGTCCGPVTLPTKTALMSPGANGVKAVLSFTVPPKPSGASYQSARIKGQFTHVDCQGVPYGGNGIIWSVEHNGGVVAGPTALNSTNCSSLASSPVTPSFPVTTGDTIKFVVDANGNDQFDTTALAGDIQLN